MDDAATMEKSQSVVVLYSYSLCLCQCDQSEPGSQATVRRVHPRGAVRNPLPQPLSTCRSLRTVQKSAIGTFRLLVDFSCWLTADARHEILPPTTNQHRSTTEEPERERGVVAACFPKSRKVSAAAPCWGHGQSRDPSRRNGMPFLFWSPSVRYRRLLCTPSRRRFYWRNSSVAFAVWYAILRLPNEPGFGV